MTNKKSNNEFLTYFPDHVYRYIDLTGASRPPVSTTERKDELNLQGYESYFTVNGFKNAPNAQKENCSSLNAFFIDIDGRKDMSEIEGIKKRLDPTFIIETKNGHHLYWLLDEPVYKEEVTPEEWLNAVSRWEKIEQSIVTTLNGDKAVKDVPRILRVPRTYYWKKTGDAWKKGVEGVFKIKGVYKEVANTYSMDTMEEAFPIKEEVLTVGTPTTVNAKKQGEAEKKDFFNKVNEEFPIEERTSFKRMISGEPDTLPPNLGRNNALLITATFMRQAGWSEQDALTHIKKVGWHGMEKERGGWDEIKNTVASGFSKGYVYSHKNELVQFNTNEEEERLLQEAYTAVLKGRREQDKVRFSNYERELLAQHPYFKKNEIGIVFDYKDGVYKMMSDQEISDIVLNGLYEDMLWGFRTKKNVSDKVACLISIIPELKISNDKGYIANVKNGLLNIEGLKK